MHITGVSGAGKSTLAQRIGATLRLPVHALDDVARDPATGRRRTLEERQALVADIAGRPGWVTDGVQTGWTDELCERAELIVWLDQLVGSQALLRIARRFAVQALSEFRRQRGRGRFLRWGSYVHHSRQLVRSLREVRAFNRVGATPEVHDGGSRAATAAQLGPYWPKVVHCRSAADVEAVLRKLGPGSETPDAPGPPPRP